MPESELGDRAQAAPDDDAAHRAAGAAQGLGTASPDVAAGPIATVRSGASDEDPRRPDLLRARVLGSGTPALDRPARAHLTPATLVALLLLVVSAGASLTFVLARGGVTLPTAPPTRGPAAAASVSPAAPPAQLASPALAPSSTAASAAPSSVAATIAPTPRPSPTSDRYALLVACPTVPACWVYTIRAGDNLVSIANWFGVPLATIYEMNPGLRTTTLRAGMQIRIPTPTR